MSLRDRMARDLARLVGRLPVFCGLSASAQTIPCAWRTQRDEVRFAQIGVLGDSPHEIIVEQTKLDAAFQEAHSRNPQPRDVLYVSGHRYRITAVTAIDAISYVLTLDRSDQ